ncbi:MAG TPA: ATP-binding cassette domain-containing protein [Bacteroidales bacterium]|nr:ATP-binding cassette domain-containing protein [Bacteroidales bacterium]HOR81817.1 ATP-binding cassette domain-containing protein [Bacteroidales bacterium]HPJ90950.1 ATP-binding cassette domain-containing protein [Bacteroidales bacterium]
MNIIEAHNISKNYGNFTALDNVSISVKKGHILGLLGPNGAGKTTLIRIMNHIIAPDKGEVFFSGEKLTQKHVYQIGYLPEERGLYKKMKVGEQAIYLARLKGIHRNEAIKRLRYWFDKFAITPWWNRKVEELSKGMQQKVQFIVTVIHEPAFYIFDEPFSGFDPINVNLLKNEILDLKKQGASIIFSTHNMASVEELCDDIVLINKAEKILEGNIKTIKNQFKENLFQVQFQSANPVDLTGLLTENFDIQSIENNEDEYTALIKIQANTQNDLLNALIPHVNIKSFQEIFPSMNDIFISQVNKINLKNN